MLKEHIRNVLIFLLLILTFNLINCNYSYGKVKTSDNDPIVATSDGYNFRYYDDGESKPFVYYTEGDYQIRYTIDSNGENYTLDYNDPNVYQILTGKKQNIGGDPTYLTSSLQQYFKKPGYLTGFSISKADVDKKVNGGKKSQNDNSSTDTSKQDTNSSSENSKKDKNTSDDKSKQDTDSSSDGSKIDTSNYPKYSIVNKQLQITYLTNEMKEKTAIYTYNSKQETFDMNNPDENIINYISYNQWKSPDGKKYYIPVSILKDNFSNVTGLSNDDLQNLIVAEENYGDSNSGSTDVWDTLLDGVAGILLYPAKIIPLLLGKAMETAMGLFTENGASLTLDDILFNKVPILSIDFFNFNSGNSMVDTIRENVATWYYALRNLAAVILFIILLYTGLRMALSTVAQEKAKYSQLIVNWLVSIALLFVLHYIMRFIILANNSLVNVFATALTNDKEKTIDAVDQFFVNAWSVGFTEGVGSALAYLVLVGMTFVFLLSYLKRMITLAFLIVIAPLVTITYSIDKMGDNKSQALNNWLKEFSYNILIQPFQCGAYLALVQSAMNTLTNNKSLASVVVAFIMIVFLYEAEKIIKHIFHFNPQTMSDTVGHAAYYATIMGNVGNFASRGKNKYASKTSVQTKQQVQGGKANTGNGTGNTGNSKSNASGNARKKTGVTGNSKINEAISAVTNNRLVQAGVTANKVANKMILGLGLSAATGDATTMLSSGVNAIKGGLAEGREYRENRNRHELQESYNAAKNEARENIINNKVKEKMGLDSLDNLTDEQKSQVKTLKDNIRQNEGDDIEAQASQEMGVRATELANGAMPETEEEENLSNAIKKIRNTYSEEGMSNSNIDNQIANDFANIREGKYSEASGLEMKAKEAADKGKEIVDTLHSPVRDVKKFYKENNDSQKHT